MNPERDQQFFLVVKVLIIGTAVTIALVVVTYIWFLKWGKRDEIENKNRGVKEALKERENLNGKGR